MDAVGRKRKCCDREVGIDVLRNANALARLDPADKENKLPNEWGRGKWTADRSGKQI